jgi:transposase-like protein
MEEKIQAIREALQATEATAALVALHDVETTIIRYRKVLEETAGVMQVASSRGDPYTCVDQAWLDRRIARIRKAL